MTDEQFLAVHAVGIVRRRGRWSGAVRGGVEPAGRCIPRRSVRGRRQRRHENRRRNPKPNAAGSGHRTVQPPADDQDRRTHPTTDCRPGNVRQFDRCHQSGSQFGAVRRCAGVGPTVANDAGRSDRSTAATDAACAAIEAGKRKRSSGICPLCQGPSAARQRKSNQPSRAGTAGARHLAGSWKTR